MLFLDRSTVTRVSFASFALVALLACGDDTGTPSGTGGGGGATSASSSSSSAVTTSGTGGAPGTGGGGGLGGGGIGGAGGDGGAGGGGGVPACDPISEEGCLESEVCEQVEGGEPACFAPVHIVGRVFDFYTDAPVGGARVVARDVNGSAVSPVATTAEDGSYALPVPAPRDADGNIVAEPITLRADAAAYEVFPLPPRVALPIDLEDAVAGGEGEPSVVQNAATDIGLIALPSTDGLGSVSGTVSMDLLGEEAPSPGGTLILAGGATGIADTDGTFIVFNVPEGTYQVQGYLAGVNFDPEEAQVVAGQDTPDVFIAANENPTVSVSGAVQIVNGGGSSATSVILALEETFNEGFIRFDAPPGLRAGNVSGEWSIEGVPDGAYVVLAAFENDGLVRDPDVSIGGTDIVHITVAGADVVAGNFKVTGALDVIQPGADGIDVTTATPTFVFEDDSSEDHYDVFVRDAYGVLVWQSVATDPGGNQPVTLPYAGPTLSPGVLYQFKAVSIAGDGVPLSTTEDLKGVFQIEGEIGQGGGGGAGSTSATGAGGGGGAGSTSSTAASTSTGI